MRSPAELLAPAGDFETALAAFASGADAVYCGLGEFSARAYAKNFTADELENLVRYAHALERKVYVTANTLIDEADMPRAVRNIATISELGADGVIVQDLGLASIARKHFPDLELHASTQLVAHNLEGVLALKDLGFVRVVLARELSLEEIASIVKRCGVEIECFIHGALCYSISGLCLFSAMEHDRSGNRGKCAYCCRAKLGADGSYPFSMKDMRLGENATRLVDAGVASLKIEGRMKSPLYVASVTEYYRDILDGRKGETTLEDLETVFSRRTTPLYLFGERDDVIDPVSLGHLGAQIGVVKRVTRDREGRKWLRFHTHRALEKHDGLQFAHSDGGHPWGIGIGEMREAISRRNVFEVKAHSDVEILLPEKIDGEDPRQGDAVYCSMSNAVKRRFPVPAYRRSAFPGTREIDVAVTIREDAISAEASGASAKVDGDFAPAKNPEATFAAVEKAFSKLGDTSYRLGRLALDDAERRFAPMAYFNELRRRLVEALDAARTAKFEERIATALAREPDAAIERKSIKTVKILSFMPEPTGEWDEVIVAGLEPVETQAPQRLALPLFTHERDFARMRARVKALIRQGFDKWEAADLAGARMLKALGVEDITADWSLYAFNSAALATLRDLGCRRIVASPENDFSNVRFLADSPVHVEFLARQSTPLFISLHKPASLELSGDYAVYSRGGLWITVRRSARSFDTPQNASLRYDFSWDAFDTTQIRFD